MTKTDKKVKVDRSFDGLRDALFDQLDGLVSGTTKPEVANSVARVSAEIIKSVSVQSDLMRLTHNKNFAARTIPGIAMSSIK